VFHVLDPIELTLDIPKEVQFEDLETLERLRTQPWFLKKDYRRSVTEWMNFLEGECKDNAIDYNLVVTDRSFDEALMQYLNKRRKLR